MSDTKVLDWRAHRTKNFRNVRYAVRDAGNNDGGDGCYLVDRIGREERRYFYSRSVAEEVCSRMNEAWRARFVITRLQLEYKPV